jgi:hypothetical protein|tara:strand:- start:944 stop:1156 length:213 start_codon:yes stop_codon:yes gene_type:complete
MARKKKKIIKKIFEIEIINRRTKKYRKVSLKDKEIVVYNEELNEFQLLSHISASYDENHSAREVDDEQKR